MMPVRKRCNYLSPFPTKDGRSLEKMNAICYKLLRIQRNLYREKTSLPRFSAKAIFSNSILTLPPAKAAGSLVHRG